MQNKQTSAGSGNHQWGAGSNPDDLPRPLWLKAVISHDPVFSEHIFFTEYILTKKI